ncbi:MAG TPA: hypothetical protein VK772_11595 [Puia sp.]|nr:hypothetical protein [Puia sp.]
MKIRLLFGISILGAFASCSHPNKPIVSNQFIDSLIFNYKEPQFVRSNDLSMQFWKNRIDSIHPGIVSESKLAGLLSMRFHLFGDIRDIKMAGSILRKIDEDFNHKEAQTKLTLVSYSILQHRFKEADNFLNEAKYIGLKKYDLLTSSFDVDFEMGRYFAADNELKSLKSSSDYGYFFRLSKMNHLNGLLDSSIHNMMQAAYLEKGNPYLEQVALTNAADLYVHDGDLKKAADLYTKCIRMNAADFHSILGLGWIALVKDKNDSLAEKAFSFVQKHNRLPDAYYKLTQMAESKGDTSLVKKWAEFFTSRATDTAYGNMYNKYLIELYTSVLQNPLLAEQISRKELQNRATPQTYAWYSWCLFSNNKKEEAYEQFEKNVSGKPLEGLELYWMGRLMQGMNKGYNAQLFYKAAYTNKYDLSPVILNDLEKRLN